MGLERERFLPLVKYFDDFETRIVNEKEIELAFLSSEKQVSLVKLKIDLDNIEESKKYVEKMIKCYLYIIGAHTIYMNGPKEIYFYIEKIYSVYGKRKFDVEFMTQIFKEPFSVKYSEVMPQERHQYIKPEFSKEGYRIGFDAGGSDMKLCVLKDGKVLHEEEILWLPKENSDKEYHIKNIKKVFDKAYDVLGRVDAIGVSSAGIYIDNKAKIASLFSKIPSDQFDESIQNIFIDIKEKLGAKRLNVMNDGDVSALAGAYELNENGVLGLAMGTSEAAGYIDDEGNVRGYFNELAFVPICVNEDSAMHDWSMEIGVGANYLSQDPVVRLADYQGIKFDKGMSLAMKLKHVQNLVDKNDQRAIKIFERVGEYLAHSLALYHRFYNMKHVILMGRVTSYESGMILISKTKEVLKANYPKVDENICIHLPDENKRRLGQAYIAAMI